MQRTAKLIWISLLLLILAAGLAGAAGQILVEYDCETPIEGVAVMAQAPDGSNYFVTERPSTCRGCLRTSMDLLVWSMDIALMTKVPALHP